MDRQVDGMVTSPARQTLADRFLASCGWQDSSRVRIAGDASNRAYDRLTRAEGGTAILMDAPPETGEDTRPFVHVAAHLRRIGLSAPEVLAADESTGFLLLEDLGDGLFARLMQQDPTTETPLYRAVVDVLIALHAADILPLPPCDADWLIDMTDPFFEWYLHREDATDRAAFHAAFRPCAELVAAAPRVTILRDYHAQNLLWLPDRHGVARVGLLDFQDALSDIAPMISCQSCKTQDGTFRPKQRLKCWSIICPAPMSMKLNSDAITRLSGFSATCAFWASSPAWPSATASHRMLILCRGSGSM